MVRAVGVHLLHFDQVIRFPRQGLEPERLEAELDAGHLQRLGLLARFLFNDRSLSRVQPLDHVNPTRDGDPPALISMGFSTITTCLIAWPNRST